MATEVSRLIDEGIARLRRVADDPRHEAEILLAAALRKSRAWIMAHPEERILDCKATDRYEAHVTRRSHGEPVAYVLGEKEFWSLPLEVTPDVLIPRPETELVVELALTHLPRDQEARALDLAAGSGAIALALARELPRTTVVGTDISAAAIAVCDWPSTRCMGSPPLACCHCAANCVRNSGVAIGAMKTTSGRRSFSQRAVSANTGPSRSSSPARLPGMTASTLPGPANPS